MSFPAQTRRKKLDWSWRLASGSWYTAPLMAKTPSPHATDLAILAMQCREVLKNLLSACLEKDSKRQESQLVSRQLAEFNIWCSKIGVNKPGQQSLDYRLKDLPDTSKLIGGLLEVLKQDLQRLREPEILHQHAKVESDGPDVHDDEDSDSSSWSPDALSSSDESDTDTSPNGHTWTRVEDTIDRLHGHARRIELAGLKHRQARIERFKKKPGQKQVYELFKWIAAQKVEHQFTRSSPWMKERIAESFARRRIRFEYLKEHQKKLAIGMNVTSRDASSTKMRDQHSGRPTSPFTESNTQADLPKFQNTMKDFPEQSAILTATEHTHLDMTSQSLLQDFEVAESVASVTLRHGGFPQRPRLHGSDSFQCPYCRLEFLAREAEGKSWR
ncbi:hypothetical protein BGZ61DRAFT_140648 [Ilyonectria robusta]|uniref:uncharacterized protein n=1 Tax=Ilyonectria robusta TaxID=1079257 RepID=UPI001E8EAC4E|nr:uncharacterized protein BGZ61DRAFT_140648 [Ilyonectria robusta]KAH8665486.1 hypothetical protein BGZ61DRAFT_140648 [Ilyonectria robusta]